MDNLVAAFLAGITACSGKSTGAPCTVSTPSGNLSGTCQTPPNQSSLVCVPAR